jgi:DNA-binding NtrC family response regulator
VWTDAIRRVLGKLIGGLTGRRRVRPAWHGHPNVGAMVVASAVHKPMMRVRSTKKPRLLAVDPDPAVLDFITNAAGPWYSVIATRNSGWARAWLLQYDDITACVTSEQLAESLGVDLLKRCRTIKPGALRVLVTPRVDDSDMVKALLTGLAHRLVESPMCRENLGMAIDPAAVQDAVSAATAAIMPSRVQRKRLAA